MRNFICKRMKKCFWFFLFYFYFVGNTFAQTYIQPNTGIQFNQKTDNLVNINIKQIVVGVQICYAHKINRENGFQINIGLPISFKTYDSCFSLNPNLPFYAKADKKLSILSFSATIFQNLKLVSLSENDNLFFQFIAGVNLQKLIVNYVYDKVNYTILNPDKTLQKVGVVLGLGIQYIHNLKKGRLFLQGNVNFPTIAKKNNYPSIYKGLFVPNIVLGYSIKI